MFYKTVCLCVVLVYVNGAPASSDDVPPEKQQPTVIPIVSQSEEFEPNGTYKFSYETGNGIKREEIAYDKPAPKGRSAKSDDSNEGGESSESDEIHVQQGSYSYTAPDGTFISVRYIADENGFRPVGDHIPKVPEAVSFTSSEKQGKSLKLPVEIESRSGPVPLKAISNEKNTKVEPTSEEAKADVTKVPLSSDVASTPAISGENGATSTLSTSSTEVTSAESLSTTATSVTPTTTDVSSKEASEPSSKETTEGATSAFTTPSISTTTFSENANITVPV